MRHSKKLHFRPKNCKNLRNSEAENRNSLSNSCNSSKPERKNAVAYKRKTCTFEMTSNIQKVCLESICQQ